MYLTATRSITVESEFIISKIMPWDREIMRNFLKFVFIKGLLGNENKRPDNIEYAVALSQIEYNISI